MMSTNLLTAASCDWLIFSPPPLDYAHIGAVQVLTDTLQVKRSQSASDGFSLKLYSTQLQADVSKFRT